MRRILIILGAVLMVVAPACTAPHEDFYKGYQAHQAEDYKVAVKWYRQAAKQGIAEAQHNLGLIYFRGEGVVKNYKEAAKWFHQAAEQGLVESQGMLGRMYAVAGCR